MLLSFVITAKAQQNNKPTDSAAGQSQNTNQETAPEPPGGIGVFMKYMIKYTNHQYNSSEAGKVTLNFVVEKDGSLIEPKIVKSLNTEADGIAIQVLKDYNQKWKPAIQNGQPVRVLYTISVPFGKE
ncbi:energy transducer TonB [Mucilaginibacter sp. X5P1]|uniref:energy transducer TonB n=1 Tax=Mucilaginibacter sp. X5P1 TaxID=2723088 RepID=UPI003AFF8005